MDQRCGNCRHWGKPDEDVFEFRTCTAVVHDSQRGPRGSRVRGITSQYRFADEEFDAETGGLHPDELAELEFVRRWRDEHKAAVMDGSGYFAALRTREDFGCVLWDQKDQKGDQ